MNTQRLIAVGVLCAVLIIGFVVGRSQKKQPTEQPIQIPVGEAISEERAKTIEEPIPTERNTHTQPPTSVSGIVFQSEPLAGDSDEYQLVSYSVAGGREVQIKNIRETFKALGFDERYNDIMIISVPKAGSRIYLAPVVWGSDAPTGDIFSFDVKTKLLKPVTVASTHRSWWIHPTMSPDGTRALSVGSPVNETNKGTELYVLDFPTDTAQKVMALKSNETLISSYGAMAGMPVYEWEWIDDATIRYSVFDSSKPTNQHTGEPGFTFIRSDTVKI